MQKGHVLEFECISCKKPVIFSVFSLDNEPVIHCKHCEQKYALSDPTLKRQLKKFVDLCLQIRESEEILADTSIGVDVGGEQVKIPYKLLLTRFNFTLDLKIGDKTLSIKFRIEPIKDSPKAS